MYRWLAELCMRWPRAVVLASLALVPLCAFFAWDVFSRLETGGFDDPAAEASAVSRILRQELSAGGADLVAVYTSKDGAIDDVVPWAGILAAQTRAEAMPGVVDVKSYFSTNQAVFLSKDRTRALMLMGLAGGEREQKETAARLAPLLEVEGLELVLGGFTPANVSLNEIVQRDLRRAELLAFPIVAVLLLVIFRRLVAALLPLVVGGVSILAALAVLGVASRFTDVSVFSVNMASVLGLGLAVDYSLFLLNRYREEVVHHDRATALRISMTTTGRAVAFSGVTVACSLATLFLFPQMYLRSMAIGGIAITFVTVLLASTALPALIWLFGDRVESTAPPERPGGMWEVLAKAVMARPVAVFVLVVAVLLGLASPFLRFLPSSPDVRMLSEDAEPRQALEIVDREFIPHLTTPHEVVIVTDGALRTPERIGALYDFVAKVRAMNGVTRVLSVFDAVENVSRQGYMARLGGPEAERDPALESALKSSLEDGTARVVAISAFAHDTPEAQAQVEALRALTPPPGTRVLVGGEAARLYDLKRDIVSRVPIMLVAIAVVMFVVLFLVFGSITLPLKAMVMNALSLTASFGAIVWIFQDGRLEGLLDYRSLGTSDAMQPILMFAAVFGLSMDYEVLILSRVREEYVRTRDNTEAVARGLERTGRLITAAAALLVLVIAAFATSEILIIKGLGVGMALAIALDATLVRGLLVPATMQLMGDWNWWAPRWLSRLWERFGFGDLD